MRVQTRIQDARSRIESERNAVEEKLDAVDRFVERVEDFSPAPAPSSTAGVTATAGAMSQTNRRTGDKCQAVRRAFAETIRPHSLDAVDEAETLDETIKAELSESLAVALAPTTKATFSPDLKQAVLSAARTRRAETEILHHALGREASQLQEAGAVVQEIIEWIARADETPLTELGFDELQRRHETLARYRTQCQDVADKRQSFLDSTTSSGGEVGINHRSLVSYIYQDFPVEHPVLATVARLDDTCHECQRAVRRQLVRRV